MKIKKVSSILILILQVVSTTALTAQNQNPVNEKSNNDHDQYIIQKIVLPDGRIIEARNTPSPPNPPPGISRPVVKLSETDQITAIYKLSDVPAFDWSFGCSATSAAMIAGYYDRQGFANMYAGPTNGGLMPLDNSSWPDWFDGVNWHHQCPLSATHQGLDGRTDYGHVDDYWDYYLSSAPDPFIGNWPEHTYGDCTGDFMKTNQSSYGNDDGSTKFYNFTNGAPLTWSDMEFYNIDDDDGGYGIKLFYESRGYTVADMFNQYIYGYEGNTLGFTFDQYVAEIDSGRPVMIHVEGHTMVGIGYNDAANLMYIHDTWDYLEHMMTWGGSYGGMQHYAVTIVTLQTPEITITNGADPSLNFIQSGPDPPQTDWPFGQFSLNGDAFGATLNSVTVYLAGSYYGLDGTHPFRLFAANSNNFSAAAAIGSDAAPSGGSLTFALLDDELPSGSHYYWVTVDLSASAGGTINGSIINATDFVIGNGTINSASSYGLLNGGEDISLPVELSDFTASALPGQIRLRWTTQSELNNLGFIITRGTTEEEPFREIASYKEHEVLRGMGSTSRTTEYTFFDRNIAGEGLYYYQLISVDFAGQKIAYGPVKCSFAEYDDYAAGDDGRLNTFYLSQNYPNPFNPVTVISWQLAAGSYVELSIFNLLGEKVATLFSDEQAAGYHQIRWDATEYASGVYYYRLSTDNGIVQSRKLILLK